MTEQTLIIFYRMNFMINISINIDQWYSAEKLWNDDNNNCNIVGNINKKFAMFFNKKSKLWSIYIFIR